MGCSKNTVKSAVMLILSLVIVGTIGVLRRHLPLSSAALAFFRGAIGAMVLAIVVAVRHRKTRERTALKTRLLLLLNGAFLGINWMLLFEAFNYTTVAKATLCYYLQPTIVLLLSPLVFREKLTVKKFLCALGALGGMVLVSGVIGAGGTLSDGRGMACGIGAACFYALVVMINKTCGEVDVYEKTLIQLGAAALVMLPYMAMTGGIGAVTWDVTTVALVLVIGVVYTGVVYVLYFGSMAGLQAQTIAILSYIDPVVAMVVSATVLSEKPTMASLFGAVLILGCAFLSEYTPRQPRGNSNERV